MNKSFARFAAAGLAAVSFFAFSACGGQNPSVTGGGGNNNPAMPDYGVGLSVVGTVTPDPNAPTEAPTEAPSEAPTAEPTATPLPEGWITDPNGIIPKDVEILLLAEQRGRCIANKNDKTVLQHWKSGSLQEEWEVPDEMGQGFSLSSNPNWKRKGDVYASVNTTEDPFGPFLFFYQDAEGRTLYFECTSMGSSPAGTVIATTDGKAIMYYWGDDFYKMHDFGSGAYVKISDGQFILNGRQVMSDDIVWQKVNL